MVFIRKPDPRSEFATPNPVAPAGAERTPAMTATAPSASSVALGELPPRTAAPPPPAESVIGNDLSIEGQSITIRCKGSLRINGNIQADLHSHQLIVGQGAQIQGAIAADTIDVYGRVSGSILGTRVVLHRSAQVEGDIHSRSLSIEDGASFDGRSRKVADDQSVAPQLEPAASQPPRAEGHPGILTPPRLHS